MKGTNKGFVIVSHSVLGDIDAYGDIRVKWADGQPVNASDSTYYRSCTDEKGVYHLDGVFDDIEQANESMYELVGQAVQEMLRKGWVDIKVDKAKTGRSKPNVMVSVYGKAFEGTRGWRQTYSVVKNYR